MTRVQREVVEHTVEETTVETIHCDICGDEAETYTSLDVENETRHVHDSCLKTITDTPPEYALLGDTDSDNTSKRGPLSSAADTMKSGLLRLAVFSLWPVTGLWLAERQVVAGIDLQEDTVLRRYGVGILIFVFALIIVTPILTSLVIGNYVVLALALLELTAGAWMMGEAE